MKILIVSIFPEHSALWRYGYYLKKYLSKRNTVTFLDLWKDKQYHSDVKRAIALMKGIQLPDSDVLILVAPLLCNSLIKSNAKLKITIVHDMYPKAPLATKLLMHSIYPNMKHSDLILPVSNFSRKEIIDTYGLDDKSITIHGCIDHDIFKPLNLQRDPDLFLHIGRDDKRKNFRFVLELMKQFPKSKLLKIGNISAEDIIFIDINNLNVEIKSNVSDKELNKIYNRSGILLFASLYEGLGMPPIEAMASGLPVVAGNNTGLKESCIKESLTDLNQKLWVNKIKKIQTNKKYRDKLIQNGLKWSKKFDWKQYAKEVDHEISNRLEI